jgi:LysM repeat protein
MRPLITVTAVVLLHLCVIAVLVGVNGCRSTSGFEQPGDNAAFSGGARPAGSAATSLPVADRIPTPVPTKFTAVGPVGPGGKRTVVQGETLMTVADSEKVARLDLAKANGLSLNAVLKPGQVLTIPAAPKAAPKAATKSAPKAAVKSSAAPKAAPAPTFAPVKLVPITGTKPVEAAPVPSEKK